MMQVALIHNRQFQICPSCSLIWFVCIINALSVSRFSPLPPPPRVLLLLDLTFIPLKRLSGPPDHPLFCIIIFLPFLLFSACLPSSYSSLTYLFSPLCSHFLYRILKVQCFFFSVCFVHVHSHCFTMPRAMQVFCSSHSVSLETLFENSDVSFKHILGGILCVFSSLPFSPPS